MLKATLQHGVIVPLEPLPSDWAEGAQLEIEIAVSEKPESSFDIDEWVREMNALCSDSTPDDERVMRQAVEDQREQAKARVRRDMGLTA